MTRKWVSLGSCHPFLPITTSNQSSHAFLVKALINLFILSLLCDLKWYINMKPELAMTIPISPHHKNCFCDHYRAKRPVRSYILSQLFYLSAMILFCTVFCSREVYRLFLLFNRVTVIILTDFKVIRFLFSPFSLFLVFYLPSLSFPHIFPSIFFLFILLFWSILLLKAILQKWGGHAIQKPRSKKSLT